MAPAKKAVASTNGAAAARREAAGDGATVTFRGIDLTLPPKLRGSVIFRLGLLRDDDIVAATRLVESILGAEQLSKVLDKMDEDGVVIDDAEGMGEIGELINRALEAYGLTPGESEASRTS